MQSKYWFHSNYFNFGLPVGHVTPVVFRKLITISHFEVPYPEAILSTAV